MSFIDVEYFPAVVTGNIRQHLCYFSRIDVGQILVTLLPALILTLKKTRSIKCGIWTLNCRIKAKHSFVNILRCPCSAAGIWDITKIVIKLFFKQADDKIMQTIDPLSFFIEITLEKTAGSKVVLKLFNQKKSRR